jgi:hypothetical protein
MNVATEKQRTYHISPLRLWLVPGLSVGFGAILLFLGLDAGAPPNTRNLALAIGVIAFVFAVVMYLILRRTRLVLSDDGVRLYQGGYELETDWENVADIDDEPGFEGLILHRAMDCAGAQTLNSYRNTTVKGVCLFTDEQIQLIAEHRFIPLAAFAHSLNKGQLRDDLTQLAGKSPTIM